MRTTEVREITGWSNGPGYKETVLKGHGEERIEKAEKRTIRVRIPEGYPLPEGEASAIFQIGRTVTVVWGADRVLSAIEIGDPPNSQFVAIQMMAITEATEDDPIPRSFLYVFGIEERPHIEVTNAPPSAAPDMDHVIVIDKPAWAKRR